MPFQKLLPLGAVLLLAGCASLPADRGFSDVRELVTSRGGPPIIDPGTDSRSRVSTLLGQPLTVDSAVAVALLRNPEIHRQFARLGIAQSDVLEASRLSNPTLSVSVVGSNVPGDRSRIDYGLVQNFTDALFLRAKGRLATADLQRAKQMAGAAILDLAADVSSAYYRLVSAEQVAQMREVVAKASESSGALAKRFYDAGNINELEWRREQASGTQSRLVADAARADARKARIDLNRLLGLRVAEATWSFNAELSLPVEDEDPVEELENLALERRLDLAAKRSEVAQYQQVRRLASKLRWLGVVEVGVEGERDTDGTRLIGPSFSLQLPLFNQGQASLTRIDALKEQAQADLLMLEVDAGNSVRAAYDTMLAARARAQQHLHELIPQREAVVSRTQELQNFMIIGQFELLSAKREEYEAYQAYLEAIRDYWIARAELAHAVGAKLPSDSRIGGATAAALTLPDKPPAMHMHGGGSMEGMPGMDMESGESMDDMPGMSMKPGESMDHSQMKPSKPADRARTSNPEQSVEGMPGMDMGSMKGMDHGQMGKEPEAHTHGAESSTTPDEPKRSVPQRGAQPEIQEDPHAPH